MRGPCNSVPLGLGGKSRLSGFSGFRWVWRILTPNSEQWMDGEQWAVNSEQRTGAVNSKQWVGVNNDNCHNSASHTGAVPVNDIYNNSYHCTVLWLSVSVSLHCHYTVMTSSDGDSDMYNGMETVPIPIGVWTVWKWSLQQHVFCECLWMFMNLMWKIAVGDPQNLIFANTMDRLWEFDVQRSLP